MTGLSRLRRARVSKARNQRRLGARDGAEQPHKALIHIWSFLKSITRKAATIWSIAVSVALGASATILFVGLSYLLYQAVTSSAIEVAPISVPKDLADKGYTSEAMTLQLREALLDLLEQANTEKKTAEVVDQRDESTIELPQTGMSMDKIAAEIRDHFGFGNWWRISSAIELDNNKLTINISLDSNN
jgi:hypothetical protein